MGDVQGQGPAVRAARADRPEYGSDVIVELMRAFGIKYVSLNPGATFRGLHDSIVNYDGEHNPEIILCTHEEIAVNVAHGYAKVTGKPAVAIVHNVVGLQHATMGIYHAWLDREPVIVIGATGPMDTVQRRPWIDWIHTANLQAEQVRYYTKWDNQPASVAAIPESWLRAYRVAATEPKGPVYLVYDAALQEQKLDGPVPMPDLSRYPAPAAIAPDPALIRETARRLVQAENLIIIADLVGRKPGAAKELVRLAELLGAGVIDGWARFNFPNNHPLDVTGAEKEVLQEADVVLGLDVKDLYGALTRLDSTTRQTVPVIPERCQVIHISLEDLRLSSWVPHGQTVSMVDLAVTGETWLAIPALIEECQRLLAKDSAAQQRVQARTRKYAEVHGKVRARWQQRLRETWDDHPISVPRLVYETGQALAGHDWVVVSGAFKGWPRRLWEFADESRYHGTVGTGSVGFGLGIGIGAALAYKDTERIPVALQPDGDLLYTPSALWTAAHHRIPMLIVMHNNRSYYNDVEHQERMAIVRGRPVENKWIGMQIDDPPVDFAQMARSFGVYAEGPIESADELRPALERALKVVREERKPALVDIVAQPR